MDFYLIKQSIKTIIYLVLAIGGLILSVLLKKRIKNQTFWLAYFILTGLNIILTFIVFFVPFILTDSIVYEGPGGLFPGGVDLNRNYLNATVWITSVGSFLNFILSIGSQIILLIALFKKEVRIVEDNSGIKEENGY